MESCERDAVDTRCKKAELELKRMTEKAVLSSIRKRGRVLAS